MEMEMEMESERIGMVVVRASELHSKIATCISKSSRLPTLTNINGDDDDDDDDESSPSPSLTPPVVDETSTEQDKDKDKDNAAADDDDDALFSICDAFHSLESHLSSFQALQQQQQYEREAVIRDIEFTRKMLIKKLSDYKGDHLDVIREAQAFASMKVEHDDDFFPSYQTSNSNSLLMDTNNLPSKFSNSHKLLQNGHDIGTHSKTSQPLNTSNKLWGGLKFLVSSTAKTTLTLVGIIAFLSLAGFEPRLQKKGINFPEELTLFQSDEKRVRARCPSGKVAVKENGEIHCVVKERVEIPFQSVATNPDVNYGCG